MKTFAWFKASVRWCLQTRAREADPARVVGFVGEGGLVMLDIGIERPGRPPATRAFDRGSDQALRILHELREDDRITMILLHGVPRRAHRALAGHLTQDAVRQVRL